MTKYIQWAQQHVMDYQQFQGLRTQVQIEKITQGGRCGGPDNVFFFYLFLLFFFTHFSHQGHTDLPQEAIGPGVKLLLEGGRLQYF